MSRSIDVDPFGVSRSASNASRGSSQAKSSVSYDEQRVTPGKKRQTVRVKQAMFNARASVTQMLDAPKDPSRREWSRSRNCLAALIDSAMFTGFISIVVMSNMYVVILETDERGNKDREASETLKNISVAMLITYMIESAMRLFVHRSRFCENRWNVFDITLVSADVLGSLLENVLKKSGQDVPSFAIFRLFRVVRVVRLFRSLTSFRELFMMLHGLAAAMKAIMWATVMVLVAFLFWSLVGVELIHPLVQEAVKLGKLDCERCPRSFSSVWLANITLIQTVLCGDAWGEVAIPLIEMYPLSIAYFLASFVSVNLGIMNLIVAVIVDRAQQAREDDHQNQLKEKEINMVKAKTRLGEVFRRLDIDDSGTVTCDELVEGIETEAEFADILRLMDVSPEDLSLLFKVLDKDGSGELNYNEFCENLYKMKTHDTHTLLVFVRHQVSVCAETVKEIYDLVLHFSQSDEEKAANPAFSPMSTKMRLDTFASTKKDKAPLREASQTDASSSPSGSPVSCREVPMIPVADAAKLEDAADGFSGSCKSFTELARQSSGNSPSVKSQDDDCKAEDTADALKIQRQGSGLSVDSCLTREDTVGSVRMMLSEEMEKLQNIWLFEMRLAIDQAVRGQQQSLEILFEQRFRFSGDAATNGRAFAPPALSQRDALFTPPTRLPPRYNHSVPSSQELPEAFRNVQEMKDASCLNANDPQFQETLSMVVNSTSKSRSAQSQVAQYSLDM